MQRIDSLLLSMTSRGIDKMRRRDGAGDLFTATHALVSAKKVLLCTGFNVAPNMPETDGPAGTAILAFALWKSGRMPVIVVDEMNAPLMREALKVLDPDFAAQAQIELMPGRHEDRAQRAHEMLQRLHPDVVMHIEVPGRNSSGIYSNMRGIAIDEFNKPHDEIMNVANREGIVTIGVGDGGNEAGMGGVLNVPKALNNEEMQAVVPAMHQILAWNSNLGAIAAAELITALHARSSPASLKQTCTGAQLVDIIRALLAAGAVDGVTRGTQLDEMKPDAKGLPAYTAVDGHPTARHVADLVALQNLVGLLCGSNSNQLNKARL
jgi:hypothetical protein